jgi:transcriptional regulator with PAS, ATPase and Fis domain
MPEQHHLQLIGVSDALQFVRKELEMACGSNAKVLITGETGVGKEIVAQLIHFRSARASRPIIHINCAGIPETLLESELFGHVRGSFTDAHRDRAGRLESAHGGTVFLDEVGEMSLRMQGMLLRFLETGEIQRIGTERPVTRVDVRVIAATNRQLAERMAQGLFRDDLFYRLNVIHIAIPPLRERPDDVPELVSHFVRQFAIEHRTEAPSICPDVLRQLQHFPWPGNVRQLKNVIERLVVRAGNGVIDVRALPIELRNTPESPTGPQADADAATPRIASLIDRMAGGQESFWTAVYAPFMTRDLTRDDVRSIVARGARLARGNQPKLLGLFGIIDEDAQRFLTFLRKFDCHGPLLHNRMLKVDAAERIQQHPAAIEPLRTAEARRSKVN